MGLTLKEPLKALEQLQQEVTDLGLSKLIIGLSSSKLVSRIAVEAIRTNSKNSFKAGVVNLIKNSQATILQVLPGKEQEFLTPLSLSYLAVTEKEQFKLFLLGVKTIGDLKEVSLTALVQNFGSVAYLWQEFCKGKDYSPVLSANTSNQLTVIRNFPYGLINNLALEYFLKQLGLSLAEKLIEKGQGCLTLMLEATDKNSQFIKERSFSSPTYDPEILVTNLSAILKEIRLEQPLLNLKVTAKALKTVGYSQLSLFTEKSLIPKASKDSKVSIEKLIINIRKRYNISSLSLGKELTLNRREAVLKNWDPLRSTGSSKI